MSFNPSLHFYRAACNADVEWYSDENSVRLSVCLSVRLYGLSVTRVYCE